MDHLHSIQKIFADRFLRVPDYQRGYAWGPKQLTDLIEDVEVLDPESEHYAGTLVLHPTSEKIVDEGGGTQRVYNVVDGQQRLTTMVILLDAIRREVQRVGRTAVAHAIKKAYLLTLDIEGQPRPKLTLNSDTHAFFQRNVLDDQPGVDGARIESERRLREAQVFFRTYLEQQRALQGETRYPDWLILLQRKVTDGLKLTVYEVKQEADVGVIFEVMNNRGKPLSEMEKVKNYLLYVSSKIPMEAAKRLATDINVAWHRILERLMAANASSSAHEDQMLRAHWLMAYSHEAKKWRGNDSIKEHFNLKTYRERHPELLSAVREYVARLDDFSVAYCDLIKPGRSDAFSRFNDQPESRRTLQLAATKLGRLETLVSFLPLFAAVRARHPDDPAACLRFLELGEKYAFRVFRSAQRRANAGQTTLFKLGHELFHGRISLDASLSQIQGLLLHYAPTGEFRKTLDEPADWYRRYSLTYFLYEYEAHLAAARGEAPKLTWEDFSRSDKKKTIEHILPQTPDRPYWRERWTPEQIAMFTHDIGNLSLTFDNSSYGNKSFPDKKGIAGHGVSYSNSTLFMEKSLAANADWTATELLDRRREIVSWAATRWHVDAPATAPTTALPSDDDDGGADVAEIPGGSA
jgi:hypothetical protein